MDITIKNKTGADIKYNITVYENDDRNAVLVDVGENPQVKLDKEALSELISSLEILYRRMNG